jgi:hypothetical protein
MAIIFANAWVICSVLSELQMLLGSMLLFIKVLRRFISGGSQNSEDDDEPCVIPTIILDSSTSRS